MTSKTKKCKICDREVNCVSRHIINCHKDTNNKEYYDKFEKRQDEGICISCGKPTNFIKPSLGYHTYCSVKCSTSSKDVQKKAKDTYKKRTGYDHNMHNPESVSRLKETNKIKYGNEHFFATDLARDKIIQTNLKKYGDTTAKRTKTVNDKMESTNIQKYGYKNVFQNEHIKEKIYETNTKKYGYPIPTQNPIIKAKIIKKLEPLREEIARKAKDTFRKKRDEKFYNFFKKISYIFLEYDKNNFTFECDNKHIAKISRGTVRNRIKYKQPICPICNPFLEQTSKGEKELKDFIQENYKGVIIENTKEVLKPYEIDIYLPEQNLAFEFNGIYWHNEQNKSDDYHLDKTERCEHKNIKLIHIYEDDWYYKKNIVQSRILNLLKKSFTIYARECEIREVSIKDTKAFLEINHIQGYTYSSINLGLYFKDSLVSLMTFGKARFKNKDAIELIRFCNTLNTNVVGGASKLFKKYLSMIPTGTKIISYADRSWSNGSLYINLGFTQIDKTKPNYRYVVDGIREDRFKYTKERLIKEGYDSSKTEHEIMLERGIYRIYDSGSLKFSYVKP